MLQLQVPEGRHRILLHCCCAPCSGAVVECLVQNGLRPALFFSNSNIVPFGEYEKRRGELVRYAAQFGLECIDDEYNHEEWLDFVLRSGEMPGQAGPDAMAAAPERGPRCLKCFKFRLMRAAKYATDNGFDVLATTLASSRWKSLEQVEEAGCWACREMADQVGHDEAQGKHDEEQCSHDEEQGKHDEAQGNHDEEQGSHDEAQAGRDVIFWPQNWRKGGLQPRRAEIIKEQDFYNQTWCGCEFSGHHEAR